MCNRWMAIACVWVACALAVPCPVLNAQETDDTAGDATLGTEEPELVEDDEGAPDEELPPASDDLPPAIDDPDLDDESFDDPSDADPPPRLPSRFSRPRIDQPAEPADSQEADDADEIAPRAAPQAADSMLDEEEVEPEESELIAQETIQERYEDGKIKVERGVAQDERENYVNHGPWKMYDPAGQVIAEGSYDLGERHGAWSRTYQVEDAELFSVAPFNLFTGPFVSQATFRRGKLHGHWIIRDANNQKVCDWNFSEGRRDGESTWYYHTGRPMRVIHYSQGQLHGEMLEWDVDGKPVTRVEYQDGRRLDKTTETYPDGQKKVEGQVLHARLVIKDPDDWWAAKLATYTRQGKDQKHGEWTAWYPNKQMKFTGSYQYDKPSGKFGWWHDNGQKSLEANYLNGEKSGSWTWWHPNGQKAIQGQYLSNSPVERWVWWHESGKVAQRIDFSTPGSVVSAPTSESSNSILLRQPQN